MQGHGVKGEGQAEEENGFLGAAQLLSEHVTKAAAWACMLL